MNDAFSAFMLYFVILHHNLEYDAIYMILLYKVKKSVNFRNMQSLIFWGQALSWETNSFLICWLNFDVQVAMVGAQTLRYALSNISLHTFVISDPCWAEWSYITGILKICSSVMLKKAWSPEVFDI